MTQAHEDNNVGGLPHDIVNGSLPDDISTQPTISETVGSMSYSTAITNPVIPIKLLDAHAVQPEIKHLGDGGADVSSVEDVILHAHERKTVGTGIALALPLGYACFVVPRSGLAAKHGITIVNAPGLVDAGYRGEIKVILLNTSDEDFHISVGDRIAQLVIHQVSTPVFNEVDSLEASERGDGGFGSTGIK